MRGVPIDPTDKQGESPLMIATASTLVLSSFARAFVVRLIDRDGGVQAIALRTTPGWSVDRFLPSEDFSPRHIVLVRGDENGVAGEDLLHANTYAFWLLLLATVILAVARGREYQ